MEKSQDNQEDDSIPTVQMSADDPSEDEVKMMNDDEVKMMNDEPSEDEVSVKRKRGDRGTKRRLKPEEVKESQEENYYKIGMDSKYDVWVMFADRSLKAHNLKLVGISYGAAWSF